MLGPSKGAKSLGKEGSVALAARVGKREREADVERPVVCASCSVFA